VYVLCVGKQVSANEGRGWQGNTGVKQVLQAPNATKLLMQVAPNKLPGDKHTAQAPVGVCSQATA
jgi:hypothetical protein